MLRIAHITDIHLTSDHRVFMDVDVAGNFLETLKSVQTEGPFDLIALTGDLCADEPSLQVMQWVREQLDKTGIPYAVIPGNHDDSVIMAQSFQLEDNLHSSKLFFDIDLPDARLIFLDTADGQIDLDQLSWLKAMDDISQKPLIVFMHHPPQRGVPYMDLNYALENMEEVQRTLLTCHNITAIFCGHYHVEKTLFVGEIPVYITPSTFFQLDPESVEFKHGGFHYGWRKILWDGSSISTEVVYVREPESTS